MKQASIITIGDELLIGQVIDTNSAWIGQKLNEIGIAIKERLAVGDDENEIIRALTETSMHADIILITGGLGPTKDDITKMTLAKYFHSKLKIDEDVLKQVTEIFQKANKPILDSNKSQAKVPEKCVVIKNYLGTAPGMWFNEKGKVFISMPGVPFEMKGMMEEYVLPKLKSDFKDGYIIHKTFLTSGIGESFLAEKIKLFENDLPKNVKLAYLPNLQQVRLRLTTHGSNEIELIRLMENLGDQLKTLIGEFLINDLDCSLEESIGELLKSKNKTISTAESCTGGAIAARIVSVSGSSSYFRGSIVAYDYEAKSKLLNVPKEVIEQRGAVSEETVIKMAKGALTQFNSDYSIAVSGIAGPGGGLPNKPVGTVWIAVANTHSVKTKEFHFFKNREQNIQATVFAALNFMFRFISD